MWRYLAGAAAAFVLMTGVFLIWQSRAARSGGGNEVAAAEQSSGTSFFGGDRGQPLRAPEASAKSREQKRFSRYDKNKDGKIESEEYFAARRKNFDKLDVNHDGKLSFEEYAVKAIEKFNGAGGRKGWLSEAEFATTAPVRKASTRRCSCRTAAPAVEVSPAPVANGADDEQ
jgi:hypothetical protein